jgi:hypothetical protein
VITRKDIAEANAKLALGRKANLGLTTPSDRLVRAGTLPFIPYGAYDPTVGYSASRCAWIGSLPARLNRLRPHCCVHSPAPAPNRCGKSFAHACRCVLQWRYDDRQRPALPDYAQ